MNNNNLKLISFDVYFTMLCSSNPKIKVYHKRAMESFFDKKIGLVATREQFDKVFKQY